MRFWINALLAIFCFTVCWLAPAEWRGVPLGIGLLFVFFAIGIHRPGSALLALCLGVFVASAQTNDAALEAMAQTGAAIATPFIVQFAQDHPWLCTFLLLLGFLRFVIKPVVTAWHAYVLSTETTDDDRLYERVTTSGGFKWGAFLVDWLGSIKPPPRKQ